MNFTTFCVRERARQVKNARQSTIALFVPKRATEFSSGFPGSTSVNEVHMGDGVT